MKEQIDLPTEGGKKEDKEQDSEPKNLDRPKLPNLKEPVKKERKINHYICQGSGPDQCGAISVADFLLCHPVPVYEDEDDG